MIYHLKLFYLLWTKIDISHPTPSPMRELEFGKEKKEGIVEFFYGIHVD